MVTYAIDGIVMVEAARPVTTVVKTLLKKTGSPVVSIPSIVAVEVAIGEMAPEVTCGLDVVVVLSIGTASDESDV